MQRICLWGQHCVAVEISSSTGHSSRHWWSKRKRFFTPLLFITVHGPARWVSLLTGCCFAGSKERPEGRSPGRKRKIQQFQLHLDLTQTRVTHTLLFLRLIWWYRLQRLAWMLEVSNEVFWLRWGWSRSPGVRTVLLPRKSLVLCVSWKTSRSSTFPLHSPAGDSSTVSVAWCWGLHMLESAWTQKATVPMQFPLYTTVTLPRLRHQLSCHSLDIYCGVTCSLGFKTAAIFLSALVPMPLAIAFNLPPEGQADLLFFSRFIVFQHESGSSVSQAGGRKWLFLGFSRLHIHFPSRRQDHRLTKGSVQ